MRKGWLQHYKKWLIILAILILILGAAFGAKIYLFINFLLGNDIIVMLDTDKTWFELIHGENQSVAFTASVATNPFCRASCISAFRDISSGTVIEQSVFTLRPGIPINKEYVLSGRSVGRGQDIYRFDMECRGVRTLLCHTSEDATTRSALITVDYDLTSHEKEIQQDLKTRLNNARASLEHMYGAQQLFAEQVDEFNTSVIIDNIYVQVNDLAGSLDKRLEDLQSLQKLWRREDYTLLAQETTQLEVAIKSTEAEIQAINSSLENTHKLQNDILNTIQSTETRLLHLRNINTLNLTRALEINATIARWNNLTVYIPQRNTLNQKMKLANNLQNETTVLLNAILNETAHDVLSREINTDILQDVLCDITGACTQHPSIAERAKQSVFGINQTCERLIQFRDFHKSVNASLEEEYSAQNYPAAPEFQGNITAKLKNMRNAKLSALRNALPEKQPNQALLNGLLASSEIIETEDYPNVNLAPALVRLMEVPEPCTSVNITFEPLAKANLSVVQPRESVTVKLDIDFAEHLPQCCVLGECKACCTGECATFPQTHPVVFLHGHAVDKDVSAEYSLEGFNGIQKKLEEDGWVNGGAVTLFTERETKAGIWGLTWAPMAVRASYYFDIFKEPENYVVVQTKSENIDTYAVRLKELVDTIKYKTGKPKVKLVAFSMGGLVARRYVQIFGTQDVDQLVLIGVPNKGVVGRVADFCPVIGEPLECRDLRADSLFMNKLNRVKLPDIQITNIVGTGCDMDGGQGDGTVLESHAILDGAENFIVKGRCEGSVNPLHLTLRDIDKYPEVYQHIVQALKD